MRPVTFDWPASDADGVALAQQLAGAGNLILNGVLVGSVQPGAAPSVKLPGIQRLITLISAGNLSAVNFTISGRDLYGNAVSETIAGPNANTVATTIQFHVVTSIAANAAVGSDVTAGTGNTGSTNWYVTDYWKTPFSVGYQVDITGTVDVDLKYTLENVQADQTPLAFDIAAAIAADAAGVFSTPCRGIQADVQSTTTGSFVLTLIQAG